MPPHCYERSRQHDRRQHARKSGDRRDDEVPIVGAISDREVAAESAGSLLTRAEMLS